MDSAELQRLLARNNLVHHFYCYGELDSTMQQARRLICQAGRPESIHGTLIVANTQSSGRGRHGRQWNAPPGSSVLATIILARKLLPGSNDRSQLSLMASALPVAVCNGLRTLIPTAQIKYPNDIVSDGRKLGGVLLEATEGALLAGFGINCTQELADFPSNLKMPATSVFLETGRRPSREKLLADVAAQLDRLLHNDIFLTAGDEMRQLCVTLGRPVMLDLGNESPVQGIARTITPDGLLILDTDQGERQIYTSQVVRTWMPETEQTL